MIDHIRDLEQVRNVPDLKRNLKYDGSFGL